MNTAILEVSNGNGENILGLDILCKFAADSGIKKMYHFMEESDYENYAILPDTQTCVKDILNSDITKDDCIKYDILENIPSVKIKAEVFNQVEIVVCKDKRYRNFARGINLHGNIYLNNVNAICNYSDVWSFLSGIASIEEFNIYAKFNKAKS